MKKLFSALLAAVCLTVFLALPASASTDTADSVSAAFETAVCDACGEKAVVCWPQTQTPWHIEEYVRCIHDCPWYNDAVQSCFVIDTYVCNSCGHSYIVETRLPGGGVFDFNSFFCKNGKNKGASAFFVHNFVVA